MALKYVSLFLSLALASLHAREEDPSSFVDSLETEMKKYSQIATDTRQNVDYMPYVISVMTSDEFQKLGLLTLRDAITLIPGVDLSIGMAGVKNPIFRGSNPYAMGQSKLIIDGVVVNDQLFGAYNQYLDIPLDIVERIEVVRGPGSLENHVNAYAGSISVITKANNKDGTEKKNTLFAAQGSEKYGMGGFTAAYSENGIDLSSDLFYQRHDKKLPAGPDMYGSSGDAPLWLRNYGLGLNARYKELSFKGRFAKNESGVSYGQSFALSNDPTDYLNVANNSLELSYGFDLAKGVKGEVAAGYFDETRELQNKVMPDGSSMMMGGMMVTVPKGLYFLVDYQEHTYNERFELKFSTLENHTITTGVTLFQSHIDTKRAKTSMDAMQTFTQTDLLSNNGRDHASYYLDDLVNLSEKTSIQLGVKFDHTSDVKDQFSPRFALVHRYNDDNIYKLMYTHSYREPSWREQYLTGVHRFQAMLNVRPESVEAFEAAYIHKFGIRNDLKFNAFYLKNKDQIHAQNATSTYSNNGDNELYGVEAEYTTHLNDDHKLYLNYSYVDGRNTSNSLANSAQNMAKAYYIYTVDENLALSSVVKYVGEKNRIAGDSRAKLEGYTTLDLSAVYTLADDLTLALNLKNIGNTVYYLPSHQNTYPGDFVQEGRSYLLRLTKRF